VRHRRLTAEEKRASVALRVRHCRARARRGQSCSIIDYGPELIDAMVRLHWLPDKDCYTKAEIRRAISECLADVASSLS
jgi:hypothetical protein